LEEIKEEDKDNKIYNNQNILYIQEIKEKTICNKNLDLYSENEEFTNKICLLMVKYFLKNYVVVMIAQNNMKKLV